MCPNRSNPDLTDDAIRKMLVQHLLTERIFRKVFNNQEFLSRNVIAAEIEKVIRSITARHFSRDEFLKPLDRFYTAIEKAVESQTGYTENCFEGYRGCWIRFCAEGQSEARRAKRLIDCLCFARSLPLKINLKKVACFSPFDLLHLPTTLKPQITTF